MPGAHSAARTDLGRASESTQAQLIRLSERLGIEVRGDLSEGEARRRIILLREVENT